MSAYRYVTPDEKVGLNFIAAERQPTLKGMAFLDDDYEEARPEFPADQAAEFTFCDWDYLGGAISDEVEVTGDQEHGQQFNADALEITPPGSAAGIEKCIGSGAIRSIGPKPAAKIVNVYKEQALDVFETAPNLLGYIKGTGEEWMKHTQQSKQEQEEVRKITRFLAKHGINSRPAVQIYRAYGRDSIAKIKENPYQLAYDVRGIGQKTADDMAAKLGIDRDSPYGPRATASSGPPERTSAESGKA